MSGSQGQADIIPQGQGHGEIYTTTLQAAPAAVPAALTATGACPPLIFATSSSLLGAANLLPGTMYEAGCRHAPASRRLLIQRIVGS
jgi:hypothetical protein